MIFLIVLIIFWKLQRTLLIGLFGLLWFLGGILPMWAGTRFCVQRVCAALAVSGGLRGVHCHCGDCGSRRNFVIARQSQGVQTLGHETAWLRPVAFGLIAVILLQSTLFVFRRQGLHDEAFAVLTQENNAMFAPRAGQALFINTVELFTFKDQEFPLGWFGALVSPWHNRIVTDQHLRALNADWVIDPAQAQQVQDQASLKLEFHGQALPLEQLQTKILSATQVFRVENPRRDLQLFQIGQIERNTTPPRINRGELAGGCAVDQRDASTRKRERPC